MKTNVKNMALTSLILFAFSLFNSMAFADETPYGQLSSLKTQIPSKASSPEIVSLETVDGKSNIEVSSNTKVLIKEDGTYFIMAAGQVGGKKNETSAEGYVDLWLIRNGSAVANSNTRQYVSQQSTAVLVSQAILPLKAGDSISVGYSASKPSVGLISVDSTSGEPAIPSIIFSIYEI